MSLPDHVKSEIQPAAEAKRALPISMRDQATLAITLCLLGVLFFGISNAWRPAYVDFDLVSPLSGEFQIDINHAEWPEIATLPGIGPVRARQIVESRQTDGHFESVEDLSRISGIGPATLDKIEPYLRWNDMPTRHVVAKPPLTDEDSFVDQKR